MTRDPSIVVCACTFRRPEGLRALLQGLASQTFHECCKRAIRIQTVNIIVADNEGSEQVRQICAGFDRPESMSVAYVHEPRRGIPFARNACLDHLPPDCEFFAFIDDDEVPAPDWLDQLLVAQDRTDADAVAGRVVPVFADGTPDWIKGGDFFGTPRRLYDLDVPERADLQELSYAATNNVIVRAAAIKQCNLRFDESFAFSGGSDIMFFRTLRDQGCRIRYAEKAVVFDYIPATRARFGYMFRDRFRVANGNARIDAVLAGRSRPSPERALHGAKHVGLGARRVVKTLLSRKRPKDRFAVGAFHAAYGFGIVAAAFGFRYQHYK